MYRRSDLRVLRSILLFALWFNLSQGKALRKNEKGCADHDISDNTWLDDKGQDRLSFESTEEFVKRAVMASELSFIAFEDDISTKGKVAHYNRIYDKFLAWHDGINDVHLLVKQDGVCYAAFRGTFKPNALDSFQNSNPIPIRVPKTQCKVRKGFYFAHFRTPYVKEFRKEVRKCVKSCPHDNCPLILTGHSQGAAVAVAATLDRALNKYNPITLAFGPLKAIVGPCPKKELNTKRIYSFINASGGIYDDAPYGIPVGRHVGRVILLDEGRALSYVGLNDNKERGPTSRKIHPVELYRSHMQSLADSRCFPITIQQWANGHWCSKNDECLSRTCRKQICQDTKRKNHNLQLSSGTVCETNASCESGKCKNGRCTLQNGKLGVGAECQSNQDCDTGRCITAGYYPWEPLICSPLRDLGMWCREDSDCLEQNCSGRRYLPFLDQRCQPRR